MFKEKLRVCALIARSLVPRVSRSFRTRRGPSVCTWFEDAVHHFDTVLEIVT